MVLNFKFQCYKFPFREEGVIERCGSTDVIETFISISNLLTVFNSSANFLAYMLKGKKFREKFTETFCLWPCCGRGKDNAAGQGRLTVRHNLNSRTTLVTSTPVTAATVFKPVEVAVKTSSVNFCLSTLRTQTSPTTSAVNESDKDRESTAFL